MVIPEEQEGRNVEPSNLIRGSSPTVSDAVSSRKAGGKPKEKQTVRRRDMVHVILIPRGKTH